MEVSQSENQSRPEYLSEIFSLCTTLSAEAIDTAEKRARENHFNVDRGDISYAELAINLASARETLSDAIEHQKLIQLPITVQKELLANLQAISKALQGIMGNSDEIVNLGSAVEALNTSIWKYGLHNLSDQVLGYQSKLNQIKQQEVRAKNLLSALEKVQVTSERVTLIAQQAEVAAEQIAKLKLHAEEAGTAASTSRERSQEEQTKAAAAAANANQAESQAAQYASSAKNAATEIAPLEASIKGFFAEVDSYRRQMAAATDEVSKLLTESSAAVARTVAECSGEVNTEIGRWNTAAEAAAEEQATALTDSIEANRATFNEVINRFKKNEAERLESASDAAAEQLKAEAEEHSALLTNTASKLSEIESTQKRRSDETIEKNHSETRKLLDDLAVMKESIKEQLAQATGYGQFGAFQSRQNSIAKGKHLWTIAIAVTALAVMGLTAFIAFSAQENNLHSAAFWIKLSMSIPLGFLITFCTIQYNRERRLEEEYAFKASISISLTPYRELIYAILDKEEAIKDGSYTAFVIDSIRSIFSSPTEKVFDSHEGIKGIPEKALKTAAEVIGTAVKAAK